MAPPPKVGFAPNAGAAPKAGGAPNPLQKKIIFNIFVLRAQLANSF